MSCNAATGKSPLLSDLLTRGGAHRAMLLNSGDDALWIKTHFLLYAQESVYIQTFIWMDDEVGHHIMHLALQAAKRGVAVRILVDCWPGLEKPALLAHLSDSYEHIEVRFYNPPAKHLDPGAFELAGEIYSDPHALNHRMHNKTFIVDKRALIVGGRNIENDYYDRGKVKNFRDREVVVLGSAASKAADSFHEYWNSSIAYAARNLQGYRNSKDKNLLEIDSAHLSPESKQLVGDLAVRARDEKYIGEVFKSFRQVEEVTFIADKPGTQGEESYSTKKFMEVLLCAQESLLIQSPYFVLNEAFRNLLLRLTGRNPPVDIKVSTNSLAATDNVLSWVGAILDRHTYLLELPLRIFEFKPKPADMHSLLGYHHPRRAPVALKQRLCFPKKAAHQSYHICLHAKSYVVDRRWSIIGSMNMDPRSAVINCESAVVIDDEAFAEQVAADIERDMLPRNSWTVGFLPEYYRPPLLSAFNRLLFYQPHGCETSCYDLYPGAKVVGMNDSSFLENYECVGMLPEVRGTWRHLQAASLAFAAKYLKPFI